MKFIYNKKLFLLVLVLKILFLVIALFMLGESGLLWGDSALYVKLGDSIFSGRGFSALSEEGDVLPNGFNTPLYPLILGLLNSLFSHGLIYVSILQSILAAGIAVLIYNIALRFMPSRWATIAAIIASFEPLISAIHILVMPETLLVFLVLLFITMFLAFLDERKVQYLVYSSMALALAILTKPVALYLFIVPVFLLLYRKEFSWAGLFIVVFLLILTPWATRNWIVNDYFGVSAFGYKNICGWELSSVIATKYRVDSSDRLNTNYLPEFIEIRERCTSTITGLKILITEYPKDLILTSLLSTASIMTNDGYTALFEKAPDQTIKIHHNYLTPVVLSDANWMSNIVGALAEFEWYELMAILTGKLFWLTLSLLGIFSGIYLYLHSKSPDFLFVLLVIAYFIVAIVISTGLFVGARLRYPLDPFIIIFGLYGIRLIYLKFRY